jgi:hypothetical protein
VFTALAVARHIQKVTGLSIKKVLDTLRPLKSAVLDVGGQQITAEPEIPPAAQAVIDAIQGAECGH